MNVEPLLEEKPKVNSHDKEIFPSTDDRNHFSNCLFFQSIARVIFSAGTFRLKAFSIPFFIIGFIGTLSVKSLHPEKF